MKFKRLASLILAAAALVAAQVSCTAPETDTGITASAGADRYVSYLEDSLSVMPDSLTVVSGEEAQAYGMDLSAFADEEGYIINAKDGQVLILGKTEKGLDRAVRHFAANGNCYDYTYTYGEGYRIGSLTVMGNPISEYGVVIPDGADECMTYASEELVRYIRRATGVTLPVFEEAAYAAAESRPEMLIRLVIDYPDHGDEAFSVNVAEDGTLTILCGRYRGALYGVYGLLRDIGWRFLSDGTEYLYEADSLDLTPAINRTETSAVANRYAATYPISYSVAVGNRIHFHGRYVARDDMKKFGGYGLTSEACHGLLEHSGEVDWQGSYAGWNGKDQPCFSSEAVLQAIEDHFRGYIEARIAAGDEPGRELSFIDVSQFDSTPYDFCRCTECSKLNTTDNVLRMTNRMAAMANEYSPDIDVLMLAYCGTNMPPRRTEPLDNVVVAYCFYYTSETATCSNHSIAGEECTDDFYSNIPMKREFEGWKELLPEGNLQVWYYPMGGAETAFQSPAYDVAFHDIKYFIESGVSCVMLCDGDNNDGILLTALGDLLWDADMTEEEYHDRLREYFSLYYGKGAGALMYEYAMMIIKAGDLAGCYSSYGSLVMERVNHSYVSAAFDYMTELFEIALSRAESEEIQNRIEILQARMLYMGISVVHEDRYVNGTEEERAQIDRLYAEMHRLFLKHKIPVGVGVYAPAEYDVSISPTDGWYSYS